MQANDNTDQRLKVWWKPQVPMEKSFEVEVKTVAEGVKIMNALADYDLFQLDNNIKPDYSNAGGLLVWHEGEWVDWFDLKTGIDDPEEFVRMCEDIDRGELA